MKHVACPLDLWVRPDEQCVALTATFRLLQRYRGHRYSVDDMLVAHLAGSRGGDPARVLDLGCGLASVLLMLAWRFPSAHFDGVEAQPAHVALAHRNVLLNGCEDRVRILAGDLRDEEVAVEPRGYDLVTGTPPYFDPRAATVCKDPQRAHAQWELRGGIEVYARAAARALADEGLFITCAAADNERTNAALVGAGLHPAWHRDVLPKPSRLPFLALWIASREKPLRFEHAEPLVLRQEDGSRTPEHIAIREWFGIPCSIR
jgi:tRNA1(Val) A37 N6-methylase TrmN6